mmetsp:Transcript_21306/g.59295  ORF Transcript_21306/g.59295 Transcript_21306/m.59295 type:complete len:100 (-) Transcript_21306:89-388(-)
MVMVSDKGNKTGNRQGGSFLDLVEESLVVTVYVIIVGKFEPDESFDILVEMWHSFSMAKDLSEPPGLVSINGKDIREFGIQLWTCGPGHRSLSIVEFMD